jgi:hypothetical protein
MKTGKYVVIAGLACVVAGAVALAQQKVAGEKWRMKMAMQAEGFSMPARTTEMCLPQGRPEQAMMQQQNDNGNCAVSNFTQTGNKYTADIKCTGKDAMEGRVEMEQLGPDSMRGHMTGKTADTSMKMDYEYTRLGQACEAVDYSNYKPPVVMEAPKVDYCQKVFDDMGTKNLPGLGAAIVMGVPKPDGSGMQDCTTHAGFPKFCAAVQTPAGFASLEHEQWQRRIVPAAADENAYSRMTRAPLSESLKLCKLDASDAGISKLQKQLAATARKDGQWGFALYYDANAHYPDLQALAKKECSGRSFTNAADKQYLGLCSSYGSMLARDNRSGVLEAAGCSQEREDVARGICVGATSATVASGAAMGGAAAGAPADAAAAPADEKTSATDKAKEALDKGKKALRGIFGGG